MITGAHLFADRHLRLFVALQKERLNGIVLNAGPSLTYLTGLNFHLSERPVVAFFLPDHPVKLVLPELEARKVDSLPFLYEAFLYPEDPTLWPAVFRKAVVSAQVDRCRIGVELNRFRVLELRYLEEAAEQLQVLSAESVLASLRMYKDVEEIKLMQSAVTAAELAFKAVLKFIKVGMTERQIAAELTIQTLKHGSDSELPFAPIVASGPNSANPHAVPTERALELGDLLIIDWGANVRGYFSDLTRTIAIGKTDPELVKIAKIVQEANQQARATVKPGIPAGMVDRVARDVIEKSGYGENFTHRTGHGLGMESHEQPYIFDQNDLLLEPGMTFTIEPGIYLPGRGGVRIEDNVVVTSDGCDTLSSLPRDLFHLQN